jgi:hypothetical protein
MIRVSKLGYPLLAYGQRDHRDAPRVVDVTTIPVADGIDVALPRAAVITVKVIDENGEPIAGAAIGGMQTRFVDGRRQLANVNLSHYQPRTDDRGESRLFGLWAGEYYVTARLSELGPAGFGPPPPQYFYPGTLSSNQAQPITVGSGEEVFAVLALARRTKTGTLTGRIVPSGSASLASVSVQIRAIQPGGWATFPVASATESEFTAVEMPPGTYAVHVRARNASGGQEYANVPVAFTGDDTILTITTAPPGSLHGRIVFDEPGAAAAVSPSEITLSPVFVGSSVAPGRVQLNDDWSFEVSGIVGEGLLRVKHSGKRWFLKQVLSNGEDVTDRSLDFQTEFMNRGLEVILTQRRTEVTGMANDPRSGRPSSDYVIVAFSENAEHWTPRSRYVATARPDQAGQFTLTGLPPSRYLIVALDRFERGREYDVDTLRRLRKVAREVFLSEGEAKYEVLNVVPFR